MSLYRPTLSSSFVR